MAHGPVLPAHLHTGCHTSRMAWEPLPSGPGASPTGIGAEPEALRRAPRRVPMGTVLRFAMHRFTI